MNQFDEAKHLVAFAGDQLAEIEKLYAESLHDQCISKNLLIRIKSFMENLRSALDYSAHGLSEKFGANEAKPRKIYFPYAKAEESLEEFRSKNRIRSSIPGLAKPVVIEKLESFQHFGATQNRWLPIFMDLNNKNKHQALSPQVRNEFKQLEIRSGGARLILGHGSQIKLGTGARIGVGDSTLTGGQTITSNRPANMIGPGTQKITTWVSFEFEEVGEPVVPLLRSCLDGVTRIVDELSAL